MGQPWYNLTGRRFGRLVVLGPGRSVQVAGGSGTRKYWRVQCDCGITKEVRSAGLMIRNTRSCGCLTKEVCAARIGPKHHNWKGGRYINKDGYVQKRNPGNYVPEHRVVMSALLGRPLRKGETVHHINGQKSDNKPRNLELWSANHPSGQRVEDKILWCIEFLHEYAPKRVKIQIVTGSEANS